MRICFVFYYSFIFIFGLFILLGKDDEVLSKL